MRDDLKLGVRAGIVGIIVNFLLFFVKLLMGLFSKSTAILADAVNNLSDFLSSLITLFGFKMAALPADREHPFGHERFEEISGFIISIIMLYLGIDTLRETLAHLFQAEKVVLSFTMFIILGLSILFKAGLYFYYQHLYQETNSNVMLANAQDSQNDILITSAIILGFLLNPHVPFDLDLVLGIIISLMIIISSLQMIRSFVHELLGSRPSEGLIRDISEYLSQEEDIIGFHDLMIHSYGKQHYASVHVEMDANHDLLVAHEVIDRLESGIKKNFDVDMVIHLDPLDLDDPQLESLYLFTKEILNQVHPDLSFHDLRLFHERLYFDVVVPEHVEKTDAELYEEIESLFHQQEHHYILKVVFDRNYLL